MLNELQVKQYLQRIGMIVHLPQIYLRYLDYNGRISRIFPMKILIYWLVFRCH